jgi:carboxypeptidase Q
MPATASLLALMLSLAAVPAAQESVDRAMVEKIRAEGLNHSRVYAMFSHLVTGIGPRLTATPQFKVAADWSRDQFASFGLKDARLESWDFGRGWQLEKFTLEMIEPRYMPLVGYPEAWSASMPAEIEAAPLSIAGKSPEELEAMKDRLKGAIVLSQELQTSFIREDRVQPSEPGYKSPPPSPSNAAGRGRGGRGGNTPGAETPAQRRARILRDANPAVVLRTSRGEHGTMFVLGRDAGENALPSVIVAGEHYNMILRMLDAGVPVKIRVNLKSRYLDDRNAYNVLAEMPGSDPALKDEIVMIGAHLDCYHSAPGATDNADGSAVALEAMRILSAVGAKPRRTIRVALWAGEEQGLLGSREYVRKYLEGDANAAARDKFSVYFNIDPGTGPIYGWFLQGQENVRGMMDAWLDPFKDIGARRNVIDNIGNTDHLSFTAVGLPGFNPIQDYVDYDVRTHHTNMDTFERVKETDLKQAAIVLASFAYHAAMRDAKVPRPQP